MQLSNKQKQYLKGLAHPLKPLVLVGNNGVTEPVLEEIDRALEAHELIKIKVNLKERDICMQQIELICENASATKVQVIGHTVVLYRQSDKKKITLP